MSRPTSRRPSPAINPPDRVAGLVVALVAMLTVGLTAPSAARPTRSGSRPSPKGTGDVPRFLGYDNARSRVVCQPESPRLVADMKAGPLKERNQALLRRCDFGSIQSAINTIKARNTSIYVLPGAYREKKWASDERSEYCSNLETESNDPLDERRLHRLGPRPRGRGRRGVRPDRAVLLRPASLRPQPQPHRALR